MSQVTVVAFIKAKPEHVAHVESELRKLIPPTEVEPGCINYDLHRDTGDPDTFVFLENWESGSHLDQHLKSEHIQAFQHTTEGMIESVDIRRLTRL